MKLIPSFLMWLIESFKLHMWLASHFLLDGAGLAFPSETTFSFRERGAVGFYSSRVPHNLVQTLLFIDEGMRQGAGRCPAWDSGPAAELA